VRPTAFLANDGKRVVERKEHDDQGQRATTDPPYAESQQRLSEPIIDAPQAYSKKAKHHQSAAAKPLASGGAMVKNRPSDGECYA